MGCLASTSPSTANATASMSPLKRCARSLHVLTSISFSAARHCNVTLHCALSPRFDTCHDLNMLSLDDVPNIGSCSATCVPGPKHELTLSFLAASVSQPQLVTNIRLAHQGGGQWRIRGEGMAKAVTRACQWLALLVRDAVEARNAKGTAAHIALKKAALPSTSSSQMSLPSKRSHFGTVVSFFTSCDADTRPFGGICGNERQQGQHARVRVCVQRSGASRATLTLVGRAAAAGFFSGGPRGGGN